MCFAHRLRRVAERVKLQAKAQTVIADVPTIRTFQHIYTSNFSYNFKIKISWLLNIKHSLTKKYTYVCLYELTNFLIITCLLLRDVTYVLHYLLYSHIYISGDVLEKI